MIEILVKMINLMKEFIQSKKKTKSQKEYSRRYQNRLLLKNNKKNI